MRHVREEGIQNSYGQFRKELELFYLLDSQKGKARGNLTEYSERRHLFSRIGRIYLLEDLRPGKLAKLLEMLCPEKDFLEMGRILLTERDQYGVNGSILFQFRIRSGIVHPRTGIWTEDLAGKYSYQVPRVHS